MHCLDLSVVLKSVGAELTTDTGLLEATEGSLVGDQVVAVHPNGTTEKELAWNQKITGIELTQP